VGSLHCGSGDPFERMCHLPACGPPGIAMSVSRMKSVRQSVDVDAESLYEAVVLAVKIFRADLWGERITTGTVLNVEF
jgi:hypothetical protein